MAQIFLTRPAQQADVQHIIDSVQQQARENEALYGPEVSEDDNGEPTEEHVPKFDVEHLIRSSPKVSIVQDWLKLDTDKVLKQGQIWRLVTSAFCHDRFGIWHIAFNMLFLYWFGQFVEATYGSSEFLCFYIAAAVVASLAFIGLELVTGDRHAAIGASGAVMAVVCAFAMWNPDHTIRVYFLFPIPIRLLLLFYVLFDLHPVLLALSGTGMSTGVAHSAHLGGLLFGYLYYKYDWRLLPYWNRTSNAVSGLVGASKLRPKNKHLRIYSENQSNDRDSESLITEKTRADLRFDDQLDAVLEKISESGQDSLTTREKKILTMGSERYRNR